jgi:hypothetical protein
MTPLSNFIPPLINQMPDRLGFGKLSGSSICSGKEEVFAEYHASDLGEDDLAYTLWLSLQTCRLEEYCAGESLGVSEGATLAAAFCGLPGLLAPLEHPRLSGMMVRLLRSGLNLHFHLPFETTAISYPAGLIFSLHLPLTRTNHRAWERLQEEDARTAHRGRLQFVDRAQGRFNSRLPRQKKYPRPLEEVELAAWMIDLEATCRYLAEGDVLLPQGELPLRIRLCEVCP